MKKTIKRIESKDLTDFVSLWNQGYELLTSSKLKMSIEKAVSGYNLKLFNYFGIYKETKLIGFMLVNEEPNKIWLKHILINEKEKNKGLGKKLLEKAIKESKISKKELLTEVLINNNYAKNFFLKNKFSIIEIDKEIGQYILRYNKIDKYPKTPR